MNQTEIKKLVLSSSWQPWLSRPFYGFIMSTFAGGSTKKMFAKIGLPGWECDFLLSNAEWYQSATAYDRSKTAILKFMERRSFKEISERLEDSHRLWVKEVSLMSKNPKRDINKKLKRLDVILREITTYVWAVHAAEHFFTPLLKAKVKKNVKGDSEKFIGDASFPSKPNALEQMVKKYKRGAKSEILVKKYGWMRARDGFARPYTSKEILAIAKEALSQPVHKLPKVPGVLKKMFAEAGELVYLRTFRSDVYYEIMFLAKPLLKAAANKFSIPFGQLKDYSLPSLIVGRPEYFPKASTYASINGKFYSLKKPVFERESLKEVSELKGTIAQTGLAKGRAKIVMSVKDLGKVKKGDILVTYMTSPNFLPAMKLAAAFVTNEGGLTCHAAIVAREMRKPCVIGTKIATKVFKDGDMVEVNANKGIVRKL